MYRTFYDKESKLWSGPDLPPLYNPKISIAQVIWRSLTAYGPKIAQVLLKKCTIPLRTVIRKYLECFYFR